MAFARTDNPCNDLWPTTKEVSFRKRLERNWTKNYESQVFQPESKWTKKEFGRYCPQVAHHTADKNGWNKTTPKRLPSLGSEKYLTPRGSLARQAGAVTKVASCFILRQAWQPFRTFLQLKPIGIFFWYSCQEEAWKLVDAEHQSTAWICRRRFIVFGVLVHCTKHHSFVHRN